MSTSGNAGSSGRALVAKGRDAGAEALDKGKEYAAAVLEPAKKLKWVMHEVRALRCSPAAQQGHGHIPAAAVRGRAPARG